jgi:prepilin-type N-terminal cleavage/methylation domain-containing protein/prepilin-type processing-associated H-X9-DG protein
MFASVRRRSSGGFTLVELLVVIAIIGILVALLLPAIQAARESARRAQCTSNIKNVALALHNYHDAHKELPATAWLRPLSAAGASSDSVLGDNRLFWNWMIRILPYLEEGSLADQLTINVSTPITNSTNNNNATVRATEIPVMLCPSDNGRNNPFIDTVHANTPWARGNYGYNSFQWWPGEGWRSYSTDPLYAPWYKFNLGMGGFEDGVERQIMTLSKITDGTSKTVMVAEMKVGLSQDDRRGVWAMGMCGSNFHCRQAGFVPNLCDMGIDDVMGWKKLTDTIPAQLTTDCMYPFTGGSDVSGQSLVRSRHPGGANCALADGSVRFISDFIESGSLGSLENGYIKNPSGVPGGSGDQTTATSLGTWQRLNIPRDDFAIQYEY